MKEIKNYCEKNFKKYENSGKNIEGVYYLELETLKKDQFRIFFDIRDDIKIYGWAFDDTVKIRDLKKCNEVADFVEKFAFKYKIKVD